MSAVPVPANPGIPRFLVAMKDAEPEFKKTSLQFSSELTWAKKIIEGNPSLLQIAQTNPESCYEVMRNVAALNLSFNPSLNHLALYDRWNGKTRMKEVFLDIQWQGLKEIAIQSGAIVKIASQLVYANDEFEWSMNPFEAPIHKADVFAEDRGAFRGGYCIAVLPDGKGIQVEVMNAAEIQKCRDVSRTKDDPNAPWNRWFSEMAKKTIFKRLFRKLPITSKGLADAIDFLNEEGGEGFANQADRKLKDVNAPVVLPDPPDRSEVPVDILGYIDDRVDIAEVRGLWKGVEDGFRAKFKNDLRLLAFALDQLNKAREDVEDVIPDNPMAE